VLVLGCAKPNFNVGNKVKLVRRDEKSNIILVNLVRNQTGETVFRTQFAGICISPEKGELYLRKCKEDDDPSAAALRTNEPGVVNINGQCLGMDKARMTVSVKNCDPSAVQST